MIRTAELPRFHYTLDWERTGQAPPGREGSPSGIKTETGPPGSLRLHGVMARPTEQEVAKQPLPLRSGENSGKSHAHPEAVCSSAKWTQKAPALRSSRVAVRVL